MHGSKTNDIGRMIDIMRPCVVTYTSNSVYITKNGRTHYYLADGTNLKPKELGFIRKFRNYYVKNTDIKYNKKYRNIKAKFFEFYQRSGTFRDITEIDINRAYPSSGRLLKIIPDDLYDEGIALSKTAFLIAVGSLYRKRKVIKVNADRSRELIKDEIPSTELADVWRSIVGFVDHSMRKTIAVKKDAVYFYWCDALFVKREYAQQFIDKLRSFGFEIKTKEIDRIEFTDENSLVYYVGQDIPKTFTRPVVKSKVFVSSINDLIKRYEEKAQQRSLERKGHIGQFKSKSNDVSGGGGLQKGT